MTRLSPPSAALPAHAPLSAVFGENDTAVAPSSGGLSTARLESPMARIRTRQRGVAIVSVITILVALILIAIPFVISMKLGRDRTTSTAARNRAAFEADLVCRAVVSYLHKTHPGNEQAARRAGATGIDANEKVDAPWEYQPPPSFRNTIADPEQKGVTSTSVADARSSIWAWDVRNAN